MTKETLNTIIRDFTGRSELLFEQDIQEKFEELNEKLDNQSVLVIGGAGTIGSNFIYELLRFNIRKLIVVDYNENGLAEIVRNIRSQSWEFLLPEILTYPLSFGSDIFKELVDMHAPFDYVANFAALKHVRSEKDIISVKAMLKNNVLLNYELMTYLRRSPPKQFFGVSTDKATNPVNVMGASKKIMEDILFSFSDDFNVTTARFANVAFSNGSLLQSMIVRKESNQPLVCPTDVKRFFISEIESGKLCLLAAILGKNHQIYVPKLDPKKDLIGFDQVVNSFLAVSKLTPFPCSSEFEARRACETKSYTSNSYPTFFFTSDTTGEKTFEEFYSEEDLVFHNEYNDLTVVHKNDQLSNLEAEEFYRQGQELIANSTVSKKDVITFLHHWVPSFNHEELGRNLDNKM